jgi:hypothetical protein
MKGSVFRLVALAGAVGIVIAVSVGIASGATRHHHARRLAAEKALPVNQMETALQAKGQVEQGGVLAVEVDRTDIGTVSLDSPAGHVPAKPSWEINGNLTFQPLGDGRAFFNGDLALKASEVDPFISAIYREHLIFQAEHMHMYDFNPPVWFIHWRGVGNAVDLARRVHATLKATSTPLPQAPPPHPTTPLDAKRLQRILHGFSATVGSDGVVTVEVGRKNPTYIDRIKVDNATNIATNIGFEPLNASGSDTAVMPDFAMTADEVTKVVRFMRARGWDIGCLYNQETDEHPQLYFSHEFRHGNPYTLAAQIRQALNLTDSQ